MAELSISALSNSTYTSNSQNSRAEAKQPNSIMVAELSEPPKTAVKRQAKKATFNSLNLTTTTYTIENGDSLGSIASKFGLKRDDLIAQLKEQGVIPKNYAPDAKHNHDLKFMKAGTKIKFKYAKTEAQKEAYEAFCEKRTNEYYNNKEKAAKEARAKAEAEAQKGAESTGFFAKFLNFIGF